jgi:hypothetical protein
MLLFEASFSVLGYGPSISATYYKKDAGKYIRFINWRTVEINYGRYELTIRWI